MKIAVTYENGEIFQHFGHTETFKIYDIADASSGLYPVFVFFPWNLHSTDR